MIGYRGVLSDSWVLLVLGYCGLLVLGIEEIGVGFMILG